MENIRDTCIDIQYPDQGLPKHYYINTEKNRIVEIISDRNHIIQYDFVNSNALMINTDGQYIKMDRQTLGEKYYLYRNNVLNMIVPCKRTVSKRRYIITDVITNKPRRERHSKPV